MKKLYRKSTVHPTPSMVSDHLLSFLPAAMLALAAGLSPADREVLAYLIHCSSANFGIGQRRTPQRTASGSGGGSKSSGDHPSSFNCDCFRCYMSYWVKWDSSPNRQLIHEIIDAFEENLTKESKKEESKKERRRRKSGKEQTLAAAVELEEPKNLEPIPNEEGFNFCEAANPAVEATGDGNGGDEEEYRADEEELQKGSVRKFVSFLGERIWAVWG